MNDKPQPFWSSTYLIKYLCFATLLLLQSLLTMRTKCTTSQLQNLLMMVPINVRKYELFSSLNFF